MASGGLHTLCYHMDRRCRRSGTDPPSRSSRGPYSRTTRTWSSSAPGPSFELRAVWYASFLRIARWKGGKHGDRRACGGGAVEASAGFSRWFDLCRNPRRPDGAALAGKLTAAGFTVGHTGKAGSARTATEVYYAPGFTPEAREAAALAGVKKDEIDKAVKPLTWKSPYPVVIAVGASP